jgi:precorrin-8X/cobalt-precorrin-8 methylmutase
VNVRTETVTPPTRRYDYLTDGAEIYRRSFATIRAEAHLDHLPEDARVVAVRMVHASGDVDLTEHIAVHPGVVTAARTALRAGAPILTDAHMIASGITRARLPRDNEVVCTLRDDRVPALAQAWGTTRSAAAVSLWGDRVEGAVVAIGNAPTALFALLEKLDAGSARPAAIVAFPVGFVGATEAKRELANETRSIPFATLPGRRGGSAMAAAVVNALVEEVTV